MAYLTFLSSNNYCTDILQIDRSIASAFGKMWRVGSALLLLLLVMPRLGVGGDVPSVVEQANELMQGYSFVMDLTVSKDRLSREEIIPKFRDLLLTHRDDLESSGAPVRWLLPLFLYILTFNSCYNRPFARRTAAKTIFPRISFTAARPSTSTHPNHPPPLSLTSSTLCWQSLTPAPFTAPSTPLASRPSSSQLSLASTISCRHCCRTPARAPPSTSPPRASLE